jgi:hypothetical protein
MNIAAATRRQTQSEPLKNSENVRFITSLDTVQQVDIREREYQHASRRKSERWLLRTANKKDIISRLEKIGHGAALRMKQCCSLFRHLTCGQHTVKSYPTFRCKKQICPDCASDRAARLSRQTQLKIAKAMRTNSGRLCLLTLTIKNTQSYEGGLIKLKKDFTNFKRSKVWREHIKGFHGGFENTYNAKTDTFNWHLHLIVLRGEFWSQSDISDAWRDATGDSFIVDIREIKDIHKGVKEVCKYIVKSSDLIKMPDERFREVVEMKKGTRMFVSGGCFYNVKLDNADDLDEGADDVFSQFAELQEGDCCPFCKEALFDVVVNRNQHIGLYELAAMPKIVKNNSS